MVVIGIIAILAAMLMPAMDAARDRARRAVCGHNLQQIHTGWMLYAQEHEGNLGAMNLWSCAYQVDTEPDGLYDPNVFGGTAPWYIALAGDKYVDRNGFGCPADSVQLCFNDTGDLVAGALNQFFGTSFTSASTESEFKGFFGGQSYASNYYVGWGNSSNPNVYCDTRSYMSRIRAHNDASSFFLATDSAAGYYEDPSHYHYWDLTVGYGHNAHKTWGMGLIHGGSRNWLFLDGHVQWIEPAPDEWNQDQTVIDAFYYSQRGIQDRPAGESAPDADAGDPCGKLPTVY